MPARIHLSNGDPIVVTDNAHAVHETLDMASRERGKSTFLAEIPRGNDEVVLINPAHVVYVEDIAPSVYESIYESRGIAGV
jgi:hypothetical protein